MSNPRFSRHDLPKSVRDVVNVAVENLVVDAIDVAEVVVEIMDPIGLVDPAELVDRMVALAFCDRHAARTPNPHAEVVKAAEVFWREQVDNAQPVA
jgi:hypothetical protein